MVVEALLRIIVGLDATAGTVTTVGQVAAIPQSGTGFQADSSGCGNIYLGGLSLGLSRRLQWRRIRVWRRHAPDRGSVCRSAGAGVFGLSEAAIGTSYLRALSEQRQWQV